MIRAITPNRAVVFAVGCLVAYLIAALFVPASMLRDVFNSLAFGTAVVIVLTWLAAAVRAMREGAEGGEWQLILGIFGVWLILACQRVYAIAFNWAGRPDAWLDSAVTGFWPYSLFIAGLAFVHAPGVKDGKLKSQALWAIIAAVAIGSFVAGALFAASIASD